MIGDLADAPRTLATCLALLDEWYVTGFVTETSRSLRSLERRWRRPSGPARVFGLARTSLPEGPELDPWRAPDGVWQEVLRARPELACFPLGEAVERAVKKTVTELLIAAGARPGSRGPAKSRSDLLKALGRPAEHRLLRRFLTHLFFELCIDLIRREDLELEPEPAYLYHFTPDGRYRSPREERTWRQRWTAICAAWAGRFLPHLLAALRAESFTAARRSIRAGFLDVRVQPPPRTGDALPDPTFRVAASDRLDDLAGTGDPEDRLWTPLVLSRRGGNVSLGCDWLRRAPDAPRDGDIHPLIRDLVEIGVALYIAGVQVPRQEHLGRRMDVEIYVRRSRPWSTVARRIERTASILTRDDLHLRFPPKARRPAPARLSSERTDRPICLFSGGLDSLAGAVHLLEAGERPIFLSHYANSSLAALQKGLIERLRAIYGPDRLDHLGVYVGPSRSPSNPLPLRPRQREPMARFLRPFMLLSLACSAALHLGGRRVLVCESGPLAIYPLFNEGQIRTRSVDPRFIEGFEDLVRRVFRVPLRIENPLLYMTKGEALAPFADERLRGLIAASNSCWHWAQLRAVASRQGLDATGKTHDGKCLPCLIRRAAVHAAGLWEADAGYLTDLFEEFANLDAETVLTLADYYRFCENARTLDSARMLLLAPDFSVRARGVDCDRLLRMFRRSARELRSCLLERGGSDLRRALNL